MSRVARPKTTVSQQAAAGAPKAPEKSSGADFDYAVAAELFPTRNRRAGRNPMKYRRFARAADAIRFAIEELPPDLLRGACLEVDEKRFESAGIRHLYDSARYPLARRDP